jgi:hypothetical protein
MRSMFAVSAATILVFLAVFSAVPPTAAEPLVILGEDRTDIPGTVGQQTVSLLGEPFDGGAAFMKALYLHIDTGGPATDVALMLPSPTGSGYGPSLALRDFTGDGIPEAFVTASTGGSGGIVNALVVSLISTRNCVIFDSGTSIAPTFSGTIGADGIVHLLIEETRETHTFTRPKGTTSHRRSASPDTGERTDIELWGGSYGSLAPVDSDGDGVFELRGIQQVRGESNADRVAVIRSILAWSRDGWEVVETEVVPLGRDGRPVE